MTDDKPNPAPPFMLPLFLGNDPGSCPYWILDSDGWSVARSHDYAIAAALVHYANFHAELVAALERLLSYSNGFTQSGLAKGCPKRQAEAALARARSPQQPVAVLR